MRITIDDTDRGGHPDNPWFAEVAIGHSRYRAVGATPREALDSLLRDNRLPADPTNPEPGKEWEVGTDGAYSKPFYVHKGGRKNRTSAGVVIRFKNRDAAQDVADRMNKAGVE